MPSGSYIDASLDPFADDDGFVFGKGRKRTKFARRSDKWQLLDRTPSPELEAVELLLENEAPLHNAAFARSQSENESDIEEDLITEDAPLEAASAETAPFMAAPDPIRQGDETQLRPSSPRFDYRDDVVEVGDTVAEPTAVDREMRDMRPPQTPLRKFTGSQVGPTSDAEEEDLPSSTSQSEVRTPRLGPLQSTGLPMISPLIRRPGEDTGYFPETWDTRSELDASGDPQNLSAGYEVEDVPPTNSSPQSESEGPSFDSRSQLGVPWIPQPDHAFIASLSESVNRQNQSRLEVSHMEFLENLDPVNAGNPEQSQSLTEVRGSDFEFLNTSPIENNITNEGIWHEKGSTDFPRTGVGGVAEEVVQEWRASSPVEQMRASADTSARAAQANVANPDDDYHISDDTRDHARADYNISQARPMPEIEPVTGSLEGQVETSIVFPPAPTLDYSKSFVMDDVSIRGEIIPKDQSQTTSWQEKLDVSAIDCEHQEAYPPPPFPFEQRWHGRRGSQRSQRSSQYASIDGASDNPLEDEASNSESAVQDLQRTPHTKEVVAFERGSSDTDAENTSQVSIASTLSPRQVDPERPHRRNASEDARIRDALEVEHDRHIQGAVRDTETTVINLDEEGIESDEHDLLPSTVDLVTASSEKSSKTEPRSNNVEYEVEIEVSEIQDSEVQPYMNIEELHILQDQSTTQKDATDGEAFDPIVEQPLLGHYLMTPDSTQQKSQDSMKEHATQIVQEPPLPPTPQKTQELEQVVQETIESPGTTVVQVDLLPIAEMQPPVPNNDDIRHRRRSPRLSRKFPPSRDLSEVVSPYFTPRRRSQFKDQSRISVGNEETNGEAAPKDDLQEIDNILVAEAPESPRIIENIPLIAHEANTGLSTSSSYYTPLTHLSDHFSQTIDILAVCTTATTVPQRAKSGPKDWHLTLHLTDPNLTSNKTVAAQIFRPYKMALPRAQRGDVVLLRAMKVQSQKRKCMLLSTASSGWSVFSVRLNDDSEVASVDVKVAGPPVEYGLEEKGYACELKKWWQNEGEAEHQIKNDTSDTIRSAKDEAAVVEPNKASSNNVASGTGNGLSDSRETYHELRDGTVYEDNDGNTLIHELRDGTHYRDDTPPRASQPAPKPAAAIRRSTRLQDARADSELPDPEPNTVDHAADEVNVESDTDEAVSSQLYHDLRNGRRYVDRVAGQEPIVEEEESQEGQDDSLVHELRDGLTYIDE